MTYLIFFLSLQVLLLSIYIWNYRYTFLSWYFQKKPLIHFLSLFSITIIFTIVMITVAYHFKPISSQMTDVSYLFNAGFFDKYNDIIKFSTSDSFNYENFSIFNIFAAMFKPVFNISANRIDQYLFWQEIITFGIIFSCAITGFFYRKINTNKWSFIFALLLPSVIILLFSFIFYESPILGNSWVCIPVLLYCYQMFQQKHRNDNLTNNIMLILIISFSALNVDLTLLTILLLIFNICYSSLKNLNPFGQLLYCIFPFAYVFFIWMPLFSTIPYVIILTVCLVASIIMFAILSHSVLKTVISKSSKILNRHPLFIIIITSIAIYTLSIFFTITIFNYKFSWKLWPDSYNYIWGISMLKHSNFNIYFNLGSWIILSTLLILSIVVFIIKKSKYVMQPYLLLIFLMIFLFINPLSLNIFLKISEQAHTNLLDLGIINFLIIIPLSLWIGDNVSENKIFSIKNMENINV